MHVILIVLTSGGHLCLQGHCALESFGRAVRPDVRARLLHPEKRQEFEPAVYANVLRHARAETEHICSGFTLRGQVRGPFSPRARRARLRVRSIPGRLDRRHYLLRGLLPLQAQPARHLPSRGIPCNDLGYYGH